MSSHCPPSPARDVNCEEPVLSTLDEGRRHPRSHLFVAATLYWDIGSTPVRIRNMSQYGALIEAQNIPEPGAAVILKRGRLEAPGEIAWRVERKAGIALSKSVDVADWLARQVGAHQERVDEIVSSFKSDGQPASAASAANISSDTAILAELAALRADLAQLGSGLAGDAIMVATHPEIQLVDIALQRVDRIVRQLRDT